MDNTCNCDKHSYHTRSEAQTAAMGILGDDRVKLSAYKCPEGNGFHLYTPGKRKRLRDIPHGLQSIIHTITKMKSKKRKGRL